MSVHRFPKWLTAETFTISHDRKAPGKFVVTLYSDLKKGDHRFAGYGPTVAVAAQRALVARASREERS